MLENLFHSEEAVTDDLDRMRGHSPVSVVGIHTSFRANALSFLDRVSSGRSEGGCVLAPAMTNGRACAH